MVNDVRLWCILMHHVSLITNDIQKNLIAVFAFHAYVHFLMLDNPAIGRRDIGALVVDVLVKVAAIKEHVIECLTQAATHDWVGAPRRAARCEVVAHGWMRCDNASFADVDDDHTLRVSDVRVTQSLDKFRRRVF